MKAKTGARRPSVFSTISIYSNNSATSREQFGFQGNENVSPVLQLKASDRLNSHFQTNDNVCPERTVRMMTYVKYILAGASPPVLLLIGIVFLIGEVKFPLTSFPSPHFPSLTFFPSPHLLPLPSPSSPPLTFFPSPHLLPLPSPSSPPLTSFPSPQCLATGKLQISFTGI